MIHFGWATCNRVKVTGSLERCMVFKGKKDMFNYLVHGVVVKKSIGAVRSSGMPIRFCVLLQGVGTIQG